MDGNLLTRLPPIETSAQVQRYRKDRLWNGQTLLSAFEKIVADKPEATAIVDGHRSVSYGELRSQSRRLADGLANLGVKRGDVVAMQSANTPEFLISYLGVAAIGAVLQTLHTPYRARELQTLLSHSRATCVLLPESFGHRPDDDAVLALKANLPQLRAVVTFGEDPPRGSQAWGQLVGPEEFKPIQQIEDDPLLLLYTSGTTGNPKGVALRHCNVLSNARLSVQAFGIGTADRILSAAPFTHLYGLFGAHLAFISGASIGLLHSFSPPEFLEVVNRARPTVIFAAPAHVAAMQQARLLSQLALDDVRIICLSGSHLDTALAKEVDDLLPEGVVVQLWGMTELQAGAYGQPTDSVGNRLTTTGRASLGTQIRIVDSDGVPVPATTEGEVQVRGCSVFLGYLDNPTADESAFRDGEWFASGDTGVLDDDGFLELTGRVKDVINRGGVKYNPVDVETLIEGMPSVIACAIVPYPDDVLGERACAVVQAAPGSEVTLQDILTVLDMAQVAKFTWPERLELIDEMPRTPTQKVMKGELRRLVHSKLLT